MADEKKPPNADPETNPDSASDDAIPEVEAEIVDDLEAPKDGPFADDVIKTPEAEPENKADGAARSFVSPGVLFFVGLTLAAIAAGAFWYLTDRDENPAASPAATSNPDPGVVQSDETNAQDKLVNTQVETAKDAAANATPREHADAQLPAAEDFDNETLAQSAKDAVADAIAADADAVIETQSEAPVPLTLEVESDTESQNDTQAEDGAAPADAPTVSESDDGAGSPGAPSNGADGSDAPEDIASPPNAFEDVEAAPASETPEVDMSNAPSTEHQSIEDGDALPNPTRLASLEDALAEAREREAALEASLADTRRERDESVLALATARDRAAAAEAEIAALRQENAALERAAQNAPVAAAAVALSAVARAVNDGAPFSGDLSALARLAPNTNAIETLHAYADAGAPTMAEIHDAFRGAAREGLAVARRENANGVWERYAARAASVVSVRPAAPQPGDEPSAVISRAEFAVKNGDLETALSELKRLPQPAQIAMQDWVELAQSRTAIDEAVAKLTAIVAGQANG